MDLFITFLLLALMGFVTAMLAEQRGRNPSLWFILGLFGGILALAALFLMDSKVHDRQEKDKAIDLKASLGSSEEVREEFSNPKSKLEKHLSWEDGVWFYLDKDNKQRGPIDYMDLFLAWEDGTITSESFVWHESMTEWKPLGQLPNIIEDFQKKSVENQEESEMRRMERSTV
jgi:hypothetical protein